MAVSVASAKPTRLFRFFVWNDMHIRADVPNGIAHITPAGTGGYPADFASVEVYPDRIEVRMHPVPERLLDRRGNIHGTPRHKQDYIDTDHPTHERYL